MFSASPHVCCNSQAATRKDRAAAGTQLPNGIAPAELPQERGVEDLITEHLLGNMSIISEAELVRDAPHPAAPAQPSCTAAWKPGSLCSRTKHIQGSEVPSKDETGLGS